MLALLVPPRYPHPRRQQKSPARGQKVIEKHKCFMIFYDFDDLIGLNDLTSSNGLL